jgi:hypothetical protein
LKKFDFETNIKIKDEEKFLNAFYNKLIDMHNDQNYSFEFKNNI